MHSKNFVEAKTMSSNGFIYAGHETTTDHASGDDVWDDLDSDHGTMELEREWLARRAQHWNVRCPEFAKAPSTYALNS